MGTVKDWIKKRKTYDIKFGVTMPESNVLKKALKSYAGTATKREKDIAEDLLNLIEYQENKQNKEN